MSAVDADPFTELKRERARALLAKDSFGLLAQVLQKFSVMVARKLQANLHVNELMELLEHYACFPAVATDSLPVLDSVRRARRHPTSYWDAAVVCAAQRLNVSVLFSEDLHHGQRFNGVDVRNPYLSSPPIPTK
ncbi:MAG: hypothetical protein ACFB20_09940 [Opitutales bacterium]